MPLFVKPTTSEKLSFRLKEFMMFGIHNTYFIVSHLSGKKGLNKSGYEGYMGMGNVYIYLQREALKYGNVGSRDH